MMDKLSLMRILKLLSAMESILLYRGESRGDVPDYLLEDISEVVRSLEQEILK